MKRYHKIFAALTIAIGLMFVAADFAEARRFGSFGSRGTRTFKAPSPTQTAPKTAPIERSMTPQNQTAAPSAAARQPAASAQRPGMFGNGFAGSLMRGLVIGGLIGLLLGYGFGGIAGFLGLLVQLGLAMLVATLVVRWFANRRQQASAPLRREMVPAGVGAKYASDYGMSGSGLGMSRPASPPTDIAEAQVEQADLDTFERMLSQVQNAFAREDYAALRELTTPEVMSYLAEELGQNAKAGVRNDVSEVKLLQGDVSETWHENDLHYATVAMRYEARDVMRDRANGDPISGDAEGPSEVTELWTFVRPRGGDWKVSAIQEA